MKMNLLSYGHCFIEIDSVLKSISTIREKGWEATFLTYAHRMVPQERGNHSFRYFCFYTAYPARRFTLPGHDEYRKSKKKMDFAKFSIQYLNGRRTI